MSLSPRMGGPMLEEGCWGPPSMTLTPGGEVGQGWATLSSSPSPHSPSTSLPPASSTVFRCFSVHSSLAG